MRTILSSAVLSLTLSACVSTQTLPSVVKVPVPVPCLQADAMPAKPDTLSEVEILALDDYRATLTTWAQMLKLRAYAERASALLTGCAR